MSGGWISQSFSTRPLSFDSKSLSWGTRSFLCPYHFWAGVPAEEFGVALFADPEKFVDQLEFDA